MEAPPMPPLPAAGQAVRGADVFAAEQARQERTFLQANSSPDAKEERGKDAVRVWQIKAAAAGHQQQQQVQEVLMAVQGLRQEVQGLRQEVQGIDARLVNVRRRAHNLSAMARAGELLPLRREQPAAAGGAGAPALPAAGDPPPAGVFPTAWDAVATLSAARLNALETFYGERFEGASVAKRREIFVEFITK